MEKPRASPRATRENRLEFVFTGERVRRYRGFSFAELMFAVAILGMGFIMVASVFPVAAEQTRTTNDEAAAAQIARSAFHTIQSATTAADYPPDSTGSVHPYGDGGTLTHAWDKLQSSMIVQTDHRYAWIPFYTMLPHGGPIRFTVLVVRRSLHDGYQPSDTDAGGGELVPQNVGVTQITRGDGGTAIAQITRDPMQATYTRVGPGSYLIATTGDLAGRVLQVGELAGETDDSVFWKLVPGDGLDPNETCGGFTAAVIGKDLVDANDPALAEGKAAQFGGSVQDVSVFSAYLDPR